MSPPPGPAGRASWPDGDPRLETADITLPSGLRVRTISAGRSDGPPVLMLHGWACSTFLFRKNVLPLADAGFRVIVPDLKGHGRSGKPAAAGEYTLDAMTRHVLELIDTLAIAPACLVGQSMGGRIALEVARRAPGYVSALVLIDPVGLGSVAVGTLVRVGGWRGLEQALPRLVNRTTVGLALTFAYGARDRLVPDDVEVYREALASPESLVPLQALLREFSWMPVPSDALEAMHTPMLVLRGTHDRIVRLARDARLLRARPDVEIVWIEGAGHAPNEEMPEATNRAIVDFLRRKGGVDPQPR